jgi:hypothetical protein
VSGKVVISGPAAWNRIVLLEQLPEPVPHMRFALGDHETVGGTWARRSGSRHSGARSSCSP